MNLSIIIPTKNDPLLEDTVLSLIANSGAKGGCGVDYEIIIIDDGSDSSVCFPVTNGFGVETLRNTCSVGPGIARHQGASCARGEWLLFTDSHMRYPDNWYVEAMSYVLDSQENSVFCSVYACDKVIEPFWHDSHLVGGTDFYFWKHAKNAYSFADLTPRRPQHHATYRVPCVLGACYFVNKNWFKSIGGFGFMNGYGSEEIWLSLAAWLTEGEVNVLGNLPVVHRSQPPKDKRVITPDRRLVMPNHEFNRLLVMKKLLPPDQYAEYCSWLPISGQTKNLVESAKLPDFEVNYDMMKYLQKNFYLQTFEEAITLMQEYNKDIMDREICDSCGNLWDHHSLNNLKSATGKQRLYVCNDCRNILFQAGWRQV